MMQIIFFFFFLAVFSACSTQKIKIQSNPEGAQIYLTAPQSEDKKFIGKAPLEIDVEQVNAMVHVLPSSRQFVRVVAENKGFESKEVLVPTGVLGTFDTVVRIKLDPSKPKSDNSKLVVQYLVNAQDLINQGDFDRADLEVERSVQLEGLNPWAYAMRGHILMLKKDYKKSLAAYEKAVEIDPTNEALLKKIVKIRKFLKEKVNESK